MKTYKESKYPHKQAIKLVCVVMGEEMVDIDAIKGLNKGHALYLARQNWPNVDRIEAVDIDPDSIEI